MTAIHALVRRWREAGRENGFFSHASTELTEALRRDALQVLRDLPADERLKVFDEFCRGCGAEDPHCPCGRDE